MLERSTFEAEWKDGVARLVRLATGTMREKRHLKIVVGFDSAMVALKEGGEDAQTAHASAMPESE